MKTKSFLFALLLPLNMVAQDLLIWGTTSDGGITNGKVGTGVLFHFNPLNNTLVKDHVFQADDETDGAEPAGLCYMNGKLYGSTATGGVNSDFIVPSGYGTLFEYDISSKTYTKRYDFNSDGGIIPIGSLTAYNNKLYGVTYMESESGPTCDGSLFEWNPQTNVVRHFHLFPDGQDIYEPWGNLTLFEGKLYGTTPKGQYGDGTIFEFDLAQEKFTQKYELNDANEDGSGPNGDLYMLDGKFYGTTSNGGSGGGVLFEWDPVSNDYQERIHFGGSWGSIPYAGLTSYDGKLYGTTHNGGDNGTGVIFEWDPKVTGSYKVLFHFAEGGSVEGAHPMGALVVARGKFYGMTDAGGSDDFGVFYCWDPATETYTKKANFNGINGAKPDKNKLLVIDKSLNSAPEFKTQPVSLYPNPVSEVLHVSCPEGADAIAKVIVFDSYGREIKLAQPIPMANGLQLQTNALSPGLYTLRIVSKDGETLHLPFIRQ